MEKMAVLSTSLGGLRWYGSLSGDDRRLALAAYFSLLAVDVGLRVLGFRRLMARVRPARPAGVQAIAAAKLRRARRYAAWLETVSQHHFVRAHCLHRSLALHYWLRRKGLPSDLRIGVRKDGNELRAHAWVELGGQVMDDRPADVAAFAVLSAPGSLEAVATAGTLAFGDTPPATHSPRAERS
jgi:hypothetical protein